MRPMGSSVSKGLGTMVVSVVLLACSPALNWRDVRMGSLTALLPCKPAKAQRDVQLGKRFVPMELQACQTQNTQFAMSHIALQSPEQANEVVADWRAATLTNMRGTDVLEQPYPVKGLPSQAWAVQVAAQGIDANGSPVQAKLAWLVSGAHVYHLAVYGPKLTDDVTQPVFSDLRVSP